MKISDKEIEEQSKVYGSKIYSTDKITETDNRMKGFVDGAKWARDKLMPSAISDNSSR